MSAEPACTMYKANKCSLCKEKAAVVGMIRSSFSEVGICTHCEDILFLRFSFCPICCAVIKTLGSYYFNTCQKCKKEGYTWRLVVTTMDVVYCVVFKAKQRSSICVTIALIDAPGGLNVWIFVLGAISCLRRIAEVLSVTHAWTENDKYENHNSKILHILWSKVSISRRRWAWEHRIIVFWLSYVHWLFWPCLYQSIRTAAEKWLWWIVGWPTRAPVLLPKLRLFSSLSSNTSTSFLSLFWLPKGIVLKLCILCHSEHGEVFDLCLVCDSLLEVHNTNLRFCRKCATCKNFRSPHILICYYCRLGAGDIDESRQ